MLRKLCLFGLLVILVPFLSACVHAPEKYSSGQDLPPGEGLVAIEFHTTSSENFVGTSVDSYTITFYPVDGSSTAEMLLISEADQLLVFSLPAGTYRWDTVEAFQYSKRFNTDSTFEVAAGKVNYIGDVYIDFDVWALGINARLETRDMSATVEERLNLEYSYELRELGMVTNLTYLEF